jgi:hypothetical protein
MEACHPVRGPVLQKTISPILSAADDAPVELWATRFDALSAQAAPEGVVHKSTGGMPGIALRTQCDGWTAGCASIVLIPASFNSFGSRSCRVENARSERPRA